MHCSTTVTNVPVCPLYKASSCFLTSSGVNETSSLLLIFCCNVFKLYTDFIYSIKFWEEFILSLFFPIVFIASKNPDYLFVYALSKRGELLLFVDYFLDWLLMNDVIYPAILASFGFSFYCYCSSFLSGICFSFCFYFLHYSSPSTTIDSLRSFFSSPLSFWLMLSLLIDEILLLWVLCIVLALVSV